MHTRPIGDPSQLGWWCAGKETGDCYRRDPVGNGAPSKEANRQTYRQKGTNYMVIEFLKKWRSLVGVSLGVSALALATFVAPAGLASAKPTSNSHVVHFVDNSSGSRPTIVLVHGAWADASSFSGVTSMLQQQGFNVVAPPNPLRGVSEDAGYLSSYLATNTSGPVILVGHSYGGVVITNAATGNPNVKALVYVDAFIPDQGQAVDQLIGPQSCLAGSATDPTKVFSFVQDPALPKGDLDAYALKSPTSLYPGFAACFAGGFPSNEVAQLEASQRPLALGAITGPSGVPAWKTIPSWDLIGTQDKLIPEAQQVTMANTAGAHISTFNAPHLGLINQPWRVVQEIDQAVLATH